MCTVSIIYPESGGFRLVTNRDERRSRAAALPPAVRSLEGGVLAVWPVDPDGGGTWVGVNSSGVVMTMLNVNPPSGSVSAERARSRGLIVPQLISNSNAAGAAAQLAGMALDDFPPFRFVAADVHGVVDAVWDSRSLALAMRGSAPCCFVSSGLGDAVVAERLPLFNEMVVRTGGGPVHQDAFHGHRWPDRPEVSVLMERANARTVSVTTIEVFPDREAVMVYRADDCMHREAISVRRTETDRVSLDRAAHAC